MNYKDIIVLDFETTSADPLRTQPVQIAAVAIHGRKLEIKPNSEFESLIQPLWGPKTCEKAGVDELQDGAVAVHGKTKAMLKKAPSLKSVWSNFSEYVNEHNYKKTAWFAPIAAGHNIRGFDMPIVNRICNDEPWGYGPSDKKGTKQKLFHPINLIDTMDIMFLLFENDKEVNSLSNDRLVRGHMGYSKGSAHDAMSDVHMTAELLIRTMKWLRTKASKTKWKGSLA
jgi:DNA polymerase III epsilon subunit-like protein